MLLLVNESFAGYLMGVPVTSYSLGIGQDHVESLSDTLLCCCFSTGHLQAT
jgi:hypothetical protein